MLKSIFISKLERKSNFCKIGKLKDKVVRKKYFIDLDHLDYNRLVIEFKEQLIFSKLRKQSNH